MIGSRLKCGEERLVSAVDSGAVPITLAMEISTAKTEETQNSSTQRLQDLTNQAGAITIGEI